MPYFVIERDIPGSGQMSQAELEEAIQRSKDALDALGPKIQWVHSFVTDDKVYCIYLAPDETLIREHARMAGHPCDRVSAVRNLLKSDGVHASDEISPDAMRVRA